MAEIVGSLFGVTADDYERRLAAQDEARAIRMASLAPGERGAAMIQTGAAGLGRSIGSMLGAQDPQLQLIARRQQILGMLDPNRPETFDQGAQMALQSGDQQLAYGLRLEADKFKQQALVRQDAAQKRQDALLARQQAMQAQNIAQGAFRPGGEATLYGQQTQFPVRDDEGNVMPGAGVAPPSYDINRVAPQLMALGTAGQTQLLNAAKVNEEMAKAQKLSAEAVTAQQEAMFAGPAKQAEAQKKIADAETARVSALFAERLQQSGLNKTNWDITNLQSQINDRSAKLALDQQTTAATVAEKMSSINKNLTDIPADSRKLINESATLAATAKQSADQFNSLASRIESQGGNYGVASSASDFLKKIGGFQGGMTQLKQEYARLRNTAAIKSLPPGPATDKDIQLALSGFPSDTARATDLSAFLRGMAKLQDIESAVANAKTDWLAQNKGTLTRTNRTLVVGDFSARPGESFNDLATRIAKEVNDRYAGTGRDAQRESLINQIPTNRPAAAPASRDVISEADAILRGRK